MTHEELHRDMEEMLGPAKSVFERFPPELIEHEWMLWKHWTMHEARIPHKWRDLIALAAAAASGNEFGVAWRTECAKMNGATEDEIKEVLFNVKEEVGWGPFMRGHQADLHEFKRNAPEAVRRVREYLEQKERAAERAAM